MILLDLYSFIASELKTIIAINDQQKNSLQKIEQLTSENEDLKSRLQVIPKFFSQNYSSRILKVFVIF